MIKFAAFVSASEKQEGKYNFLHIMYKGMEIRVKVATFVVLACSAVIANTASANEMEIRALLGVAKASTSNITGQHLPESGTPPAVPATVTMADSNSKLAPTIGVDVNYYFNDNWGVNAGISYKKYTTNDTYVTINAAGGAPWTSSFPSFSLTGYEISAGPLYRWKDVGSSGKFAPFLGLNFVGFIGTQSNTNYSLANVTLTGGTPKYVLGAPYGVGGPETNVSCFGYMPRFGVAYDLDKAMNIGAEYRYASMKCNNGAMRSLQSGYKSDFVTNSLMFSVGFKFQ